MNTLVGIMCQMNREYHLRLRLELRGLPRSIAGLLMSEYIHRWEI
jgi:hypothetical protein